MVVVLKVEGLRKHTNEGEIRRFFGSRNSRPDDIHLVFQAQWERAIAFLAYQDPNSADNGLKLDGVNFRNEQISVLKSDEIEFKDVLPGKQLITHFQSGFAGFSSVVKVEGLDNKTVLGEIRKHFKERDARPDNIHLVSDGRHGLHTGIAFIIFMERGMLEKALKVDGTILKNNMISVRESNALEFSQYFPNVPLVQPKPTNTKVHNGRQFVGFIKVTGFDLDVRLADIRRSFCEWNARPEDIRLITNNSGKHIGAAVLIYANEMLYQAARKVDGNLFRGRKITVLVSNEKEFNFYFPDVNSQKDSSFSKPPSEDHRRQSFSGGRNELEDYNRDDKRGLDRRFRERSRSPVRSSRPLPSLNSTPNQAYIPPVLPQDPNLPGVDRSLFLTMLGLPIDVSATQIVNFFQPITVHDIYIMRRESGNKCRVIVEFYNRELANKAFNTKKGEYLANAFVDLFYSNSDDISRALNLPSTPPVKATTPVPQNTGGDGNQMQNLLGLLTATVTAMATQQQPQAATPKAINSSFSEVNTDPRDRERGCVVGVRNLAHSVTTEDILHFFHGFHAIADSVKIHRLSDGRCSGDAVISFRNNGDAVHAVSSLHGRSLGSRRLDLFNLRSV